jgi:molybdopterin molybdotransferase
MKHISDSPMKPVSEALAYMLKHAKGDLATETINLMQAHNRILAQAQIAQMDVPPADNSAMDGYALNFHDLQQQPLEVSQRIAAGQVSVPLQSGTAARVFTGAEIPAGANLVIAQEDCEIQGMAIKINGQHQLRQFIRRCGQDITRGTLACHRGTRLKARHMGVLASIGLAKIVVYRPLRVGIICTGSELIEPGQSLYPGQIYNSNRYLITGLCAGLGFNPIDLGIVTDHFDTTLKALKQAAAQVDVIITSGGISVGEEDHVKAAAQQLGQLEWWKLASKPGKPMAFGHIQNTPFLGLPGNPASVLVTFTILAKPFLLALQGQCTDPDGPVVLTGQLLNPPKQTSERQQYLRARVVSSTAAQGLQLEILADQSSAVLTTAIKGHGLVVIPPAQAGAEIKQVVFLPYSQLEY